jgi:hypothetical protein
MKKPLLLLIGTFVSTFSFSQLFSDDFEGYAAGSYVGPQSTSWTTWSGTEGGAEDAQVTNNQASSGTNSIYIGNPMCGSFPDPKVVKKITFVKYTQYANALINSVMFFKDTFYYYPVFNRNMMTLDAYRTCMSMLSYGNTSYCESYKSVGQYVMKTF